MSQSTTLTELKQKLRATFWKLRCTDEEWRKKLFRLELNYLSNSIQYLQSSSK